MFLALSGNIVQCRAYCWVCVIIMASLPLLCCNINDLVFKGYRYLLIRDWICSLISRCLCFRESLRFDLVIFTWNMYARELSEIYWNTSTNVADAKGSCSRTQMPWHRRHTHTRTHTSMTSLQPQQVHVSPLFTRASNTCTYRTDCPFAYAHKPTRDDQNACVSFGREWRVPT